MQSQTEGSHTYSKSEKTSIIVSCALGFALDLYDVLILPFLMPSIQASLHVSLTHTASITSITLIGSVIGGALFGWLGDRIGRKNALQMTLAIFGLGSVLSAFAWDYGSLAALRFITGIGLGGEWGAGMVLFNEAWDHRRRGIGSALVQGSSTIAAASASVVGVWAISTFSPDWGWRVGLLTGGAPLVLMVFIRFFMPESKIWQEFDARRKAGRLPHGGDSLGSVAAMFRPPLLSRTAACTTLMMGYMLCYYSIVVFMPTYMMKVGHAPAEAVRAATLIAALCNAAGYVATGLGNDRFGRRFGALAPAFLWFIALGGLYLFGQQPYQGSVLLWPLCWCYVLFNVGNTALGVVGPWMSELYPTHVRATAASTNYMAGRAIGSIGPTIVPVIAGLFAGDLRMGMMVALPAALAFFIAAIILPETRGRTLSMETAPAPCAAAPGEPDCPAPAPERS